MKNTARLLNLDILRLLSAVCVLFYHYGFRMEVTGEGGDVSFPEFRPVAIWLDAGLLIFFAVSGYVITLSAEGRSAYDFAVGRVARLWPTFVLCATISAIILYLWPVVGVPIPTISQWLAQFVMNSRVLGQPFIDGAYWTIAYEVIFYGWVFLLVMCGLYRTHWKEIVIAWLLISVANELIIDTEVLRKLFITEYSGFFIFGMVLYRLQQNWSTYTVLLLLAATLWATCALVIMEPKFVELYGVHRNIYLTALVGPVSVGLVTLFVALPTLPIKPTLAIAIGGLTYPLYLLHQNIGYSAFAHLGGSYGRWVILAGLVTVLVFVSWLIATFHEPAARAFIIDRSKVMRRTWSRYYSVG